MKILLSKFGILLSSRPSGREAYLFTKTYLLNTNQDKVEIDFTDVKVLTPAWADEFFTPLKKELGSKLIILSSQNPSVQSSLKMINL